METANKYDTSDAIIIGPVRNFIFGLIVLCVILIVWWELINFFYPRDFLTMAWEWNEVQLKFVFRSINLTASILIGALVLKHYTNIKVGYMAVLKIRGRRWEYIFKQRILFSEGYQLSIPGIIEYEMGSMKIDRMSVTAISLAKSDAKNSESQMFMRTEFNFPFRIYDINANFGVEEKTWREGVADTMENSAEIVHSTNTGDELMGNSRSEIARLIQTKFMGMHDPKDKMLIKEWGIEVLTPITVKNCRPESAEVARAYDAVRIEALRAKNQTIRATNLAKLRQLLKTGKYIIKSVVNGKEVIDKVKITDYDILTLDDKKILDVLQLEKEIAGKQEVIIDSNGNEISDSLLKAFIASQKVK